MSSALELQAAAASVPWPSEFELKVRSELAEIRAHQLRTDSLIMKLQLDAMQAAEAQREALLALTKAVHELVGNGHG